MLNSKNILLIILVSLVIVTSLYIYWYSLGYNTIPVYTPDIKKMPQTVESTRSELDVFFEKLKSTPGDFMIEKFKLARERKVFLESNVIELEKPFKIIYPTGESLKIREHEVIVWQGRPYSSFFLQKYHDGGFETVGYIFWSTVPEVEMPGLWKVGEVSMGNDYNRCPENGSCPDVPFPLYCPNAKCDYYCPDGGCSQASIKSGEYFIAAYNELGELQRTERPITIVGDWYN